jgi:hypothetical protein
VNDIEPEKKPRQGFIPRKGHPSHGNPKLGQSPDRSHPGFNQLEHGEAPLPCFYRIRLFLAGVKPMKQFMNRLSIILNLICIALNAYIIYLILCKKEEPYA